MITDLLLESDTRDLDNRGVWPGGILLNGRPAEFGALWLRQRADGDLDILQADPIVLMTAEFLARVTSFDPRVLTAQRRMAPGSTVTLFGHGQQVTYRVLAFHHGVQVWLLAQD